MFKQVSITKKIAAGIVAGMMIGSFAPAHATITSSLKEAKDSVQDYWNKNNKFRVLVHFGQVAAGAALVYWGGSKAYNAWFDNNPEYRKAKKEHDNAVEHHWAAIRERNERNAADVFESKQEGENIWEKQERKRRNLKKLIKLAESNGGVFAIEKKNPAKSKKNLANNVIAARTDVSIKRSALQGVVDALAWRFSFGRASVFGGLGFIYYGLKGLKQEWDAKDADGDGASDGGYTITSG